MATDARTRVLNRLLGRRVYFHGKFARGVREQLAAAAEAQQGLVADDLTKAVDYLVVADAAGSKTEQKKAAALNAKGANIRVTEADAFAKLVAPTADEVLALIRGGRDNAAVLTKAVGGRAAWAYGPPPPPTCTLTGESFDDLDLAGFDFHPIAFVRCSFKNAVVEGATFASIADCDFTGATGGSARFFEVQSGRFVGADLEGVQFMGHPAGCDFTEAKLERGAFSTDFYSAANAWPKTAAGAVFRRAILRGVKFFGLKLEAPDFSGADLGGAIIGGCRFGSADFHSANFGGGRWRTTRYPARSSPAPTCAGRTWRARI